MDVCIDTLEKEGKTQYDIAVQNLVSQFNKL